MVPGSARGWLHADPERVDERLPSGLIPVYRDGSRFDGWDFADAERTQIQLYGPACDLFNEAPENEVVVVLACETLVK